MSFFISFFVAVRLVSKKRLLMVPQKYSGVRACIVNIGLDAQRNSTRDWMRNIHY